MAQQFDIVGNLLLKVDNAEAGLNKLKNGLSKLEIPKGLDKNLTKSFTNLDGIFERYRTQLSKGFQTKGDVTNFAKIGKELDTEMSKVSKYMTELTGKTVDFKINSEPIRQTEQALEKLLQKQEQLTNTTLSFKIDTEKGSNSIKEVLEDIQKIAGNTGTGKAAGAALIELQLGNVDQAKAKLDEIIASYRRLGDTKKAAEVAGTGLNIAQAATEVKNQLDTASNGLQQVKNEATQTSEALAQMRYDQLGKAANECDKLAKEMDETAAATNQANKAAQEYAQSAFNMAKQMEQLQQSTQYFFSLRNMINLLKRGIHEAVDVVKELDAAMTETAVVTDFSVGDMWQKLPEYTANANALGASVKDMYEATTLYYQQGLRTDAAMGIANETMKMARIGGLDAADATDKMTAALRGFNMEINEASAQRVNDVYSNLAAKTASDTEELGTAMQRTASIAASAGMSFEGTAAFLAQAIETTREPAENLGTAMKTIVARFTELKKNPLEIAEVDGEEVSYNKVDTALQSIGVSLKDANGQFRDLDKVFLDISKRWDSLTQTQQRYIATTAAGSRQQSRFIAMMSNYERTTQLMDFANNSAGASNEQFGKTMESLEAKLNKLRNAWNEFLMGIMNDSATKFVVDTGTKILDLVNKIIDKLSFNGELGLVKSLLSIATAFTALKAGGNIVNKLIGGLGGLVDPTSSFGKGFWGAGKTTPEGTPAAGIAGKITTPIVAKLNELIAVTKGSKEGQIKTNSTIDQYKATNQALRKINGMDMGTIGALFGGLSNEQAYAAYKNAPGTTDAMKQASLGWLGSKKMPADAQKTGQQLMSAIFKGMSKKEISVKDGIKLLGQPEKWGQQFGTDVAWNFSNNFSKELTAQANERALQNLGLTQADIADLTVGSDALKDFIKYTDGYKEAFIKARNEIQTEGLLDNVQVTQTGFQQFANKVGSVGSAFSTAGMSLQMFGAQLGQLSPALQGVGNLLAKIGMAANTFGMGVSGIGTIVTKLGGRIIAGQAAVKYGSAAMAKAVASGAVAAESTVAATGTGAASAFISGFTGGMSAGPIAAIIIGVLTGGLMIAKGIIDKKAKEAGQEVRENFEKGFTETNKKIDSLEGYKDRFNELSKGVDQFGHNINLTDEEFDEYLSISRELQELSPSLIAGYNAEGQAILRKGAALDEVINKLKEERDASLSDYIDNGSIEKLINEYKTSDTYSKHHKQEDHVSYYSGTVTPGAGAFDTEKTGISKAVKQAGLEWSDFSQILNELGIGSAESIDQLTNRQLSLISDHYSDILNKIREVNPQIETEAEDGLREAFANTNNAIEDVLSEGAPITEALRQWMGQEHLDAVGLNLGEEFVGGFNSGLEGLMLEGLTNNWKPEEYKQQLKEYSNEWKNLAGPTSDYTRILKEADEIQEDYLDHIGEEGAIEDYKENIEDSAQKLEDLANSTDTATEAGQIFAEQCMQQANALRNYATEGAVSLAEALNVLSGKFAEARGAKERFDKATEGGDYYTAAEGFRSIAETVLDDKNVAGDGSLTGWIGAEQLLGQNFVDNHSWNQIVSHLKTVNGLFDDGIEGVYNFNDMLVQAVNEGKDLSGLGEVVDGAFHFDFDNVDNLKQYADLLGISEDVLAGMIDKSRQFAAFNVGNNKQIRQALEQSEQAMVGQTYGKNGKSNLYMSEAAFRTEAYAQGIRGNDYTKTKSDLTKEQNVQFLTVDSLTTKSKDGLGIDKVLKDVGLDGADKTLNNTVAALTKMGFDLEDQKRILTTDGLKLADGDATADAIEQAYQEQEFASENPTVAGIANNTGVIATAATALLAKMGILTDQAKKEIETSTSKDTVDGIKKSLTPEGGFKDASSREAARAGVESKIADYNATIANLESSGNEALQPYIDKLISARDDLQLALDTEATTWESKLSEASTALQGIGTEVEQAFLQDKSVDIANIVNQEDILGAANALRQLEEEGDLSHSTMAQLAADFLQFRQGDLLQLNSTQLDQLATKLGLTKEEATGLFDVLRVPFSLEGRIEGEDLVHYIQQYEGLNDVEKGILLRANTTGEEKVTGLINVIDQEFGDGTEETKTIFLQAEAKMAGGDAAGAEKLLKEAGFSDTEVKEITQKLSITVNGTVANKDEVQNSLNSQLENMELNTEVRANVKATLDIGKQAQSATVNYKAGSQEKAKDQNAGVNYNRIIDQKKPEDKNAGVNYTWKSQDAPKDKTAWVTYKEKNARGRKYSIPAYHSLSFGAAAKGLNLNRASHSSKKQITSLVGEEGYEVGYIPSEQRSVIFGANGPEMTSFPSDTVIYPHDQSKEILRRGKGKHQTAGSFVSGTLPSRSSGGGGGTATSKKVHQAANTVQKKATETAKAVQKVSVWWENIARKTEAAQRQQDQNQKAFEKYIKEMRATLKNTGVALDKGGGGGDDYLKSISTTMGYYEAQLKKVADELDVLNKGTSAQQKAKTSKEKTKANKAAYENDAASAAQVSYKNGKKTKEEIVNLADYIKQENGVFIVDQAALDKISSKEKRKAVADAANKEINDRLSKKYKAEDEIQKAQEAIEKFGEELYNTFFKWETELTKIWNITQQIEQTEARISRNKGYSDLLISQLSTGMAKAGGEFSEKTLAAFKTGIDNQSKQLDQTLTSLNLKKNNLNQLLSLNDEKTTLSNIQQKLVDDIYADAKIKKATDEKSAKKTALDNANNNLTKAQNDKKALENEKKQLEADKKKTKSKKKRAKIQKKIDAVNKKITTSDKNIKTYQANITKAQEAYDKASLNATNVTNANKDANLNSTQKLGYETQAAELEKQINAQAKAWEFLTVTQRGDGTIDLSFDAKTFEKEKQAGNINEELGKNIQDYVKELVEANKDVNAEYENVTSRVNDMYGSLQTLQDQWVGYAEDLWKISEEEQKREVDNLKKFSDSITNTLKNLLDEIKRKLDQRRKQEDNIKTEQDISRKQQRLAALQADTSGGHQVEIAQLQQEIADAQQNYQRSLEDQLLDNLQQQADLAAQQREQQIALQEATITAVNNAALVNQWMDDPVTYKDAIFEAYKTANDFDEKPKALQDELIKKFEVMYDGLINNQNEQEYITKELEQGEATLTTLSAIQQSITASLNNQTEQEYITKEIEQGEATLAALNAIQQSIAALATNASSEKVTGGSGVTEGGTAAAEAAAEKAVAPAPVATPKAAPKPAVKATPKISTVSATLKKGSKGNDVKLLQQALNALGYTDAKKRKLAVDGKFGANTLAAVKKFQKASKGLKVDGIVGPATKKAFANKGYKTGGLADYTGPAWLDGTPSKPELVLNATDTKNFVALKDILAKVMNGVGVESSTTGDINYEININVDKIEKDYDVDKVIDKVKKEIIKSAGYRNVTQIRNLR